MATPREATVTSSPLLLARGTLVDTCFQRSDVAIIVATNSISIKAVGVVEKVFAKYPYGDSISSREQLYDLPRAVRKDRADVGSMQVKRSEGKRDPVIISLVSQFNFGKSIEDNKIAQNLMKSSKDFHFKFGLENDTALGRINNFKRAITTLSDFAKLKKNEDLGVYAFPCGIGRSGKMDDVWVEEYLPVLKMFAEDVIQYGVTTLLVTDLETIKIPSKVSVLSAPLKKMGFIEEEEN